jgi:hypothetical protein
MVDRIELVGAGALPRTTSGKLRRKECTARTRERRDDCANTPPLEHSRCLQRAAREPLRPTECLGLLGADGRGQRTPRSAQPWVHVRRTVRAQARSDEPAQSPCIVTRCVGRRSRNPQSGRRSTTSPAVGGAHDAQTFPARPAGFLGLNLVDALVALMASQPRCGRRARTNVLALRQRKVPLVQTDFDAARHAARGDGGHRHRVPPRRALPTPLARPAEGARPRPRAARATCSTRQRAQACAGSSTSRRPRPSRPRADGSPPPRPTSSPRHRPWGAYHDLKWHLEARALAETRLEVLIACPGACLGPVGLARRHLGDARRPRARPRRSRTLMAS